MIDKLILYFSTLPTVRYAALSLLLIGLCASLLGVALVLKHLSMIGDGLSHVAFGSTAVATVLGLTLPIYLTLPLTVIASVLLLRLGQSARLRADASIAMVSAGSLAFGYLLLSLFPTEGGSGGAACASLFGTGIISIDINDMIICSALAGVMLFAFMLFYNKIFAVTFDEDFALATGIKTNVYNTVIAVATGITVVVGMSIVGALPVSALITFPALSAMRIFKTFKGVTVCAACISVVCTCLGVLASLVLATPIGPTIVVADLAVFVVCCVIGAARKMR